MSAPSVQTSRLNRAGTPHDLALLLGAIDAGKVFRTHSGDWRTTGRTGAANGRPNKVRVSSRRLNEWAAEGLVVLGETGVWRLTKESAS